MTQTRPPPGAKDEAPLTMERFVERYRQVEQGGYGWAELDRALEEYCARHPDHGDAGRTFAKVALINRAYGANLQMGCREAERAVAEALVSSDLDAQLARLRALKAFDRASAPQVIEAHRVLVELCHRVTARRYVSFASKYLAFHAPNAAPLYDSLAERVGRRLVGAEERAPPWAGLSGPYAAHCATVLALMRRLQERGLNPDVKRVDVVLYGLGGGVG